MNTVCRPKNALVANFFIKTVACSLFGNLSLH